MTDHNIMALSPNSCQMMYSSKKPAMRGIKYMRPLNHNNVSGV